MELSGLYWNPSDTLTVSPERANKTTHFSLQQYSIALGSKGSRDHIHVAMAQMHESLLRLARIKSPFKKVVKNLRYPGFPYGHPLQY